CEERVRALLTVAQRLRRPRAGQHGLRQPRTHVDLAPSPGGTQPVHRHPRHHAHKVGLSSADIGRCTPAQVRVLNRILGVARGAEDAIRDREQPTPLRLELAVRECRLAHHHPPAISATVPIRGCCESPSKTGRPTARLLFTRTWPVIVSTAPSGTDNPTLRPSV